MNKKCKQIIDILLLVSATVCLCAFSTFRGESGTGNANVVSYDTPIVAEQSGAIWSHSFLNAGTTSYNSIPILTENCIYLVNTNILYEMNYQGHIQRQITLPAKMNSVCYMLLEKNHLYIPLNSGILICVNINSMTLEWQSTSVGGQSLSTVFYHNGYLYAASTTVTNRGTTGVFYCLNATNGSTVWTYEDTEHPGGYYWSGGIVHDDILYFSGDNGILVSHSLLTDEVYDTYLLTDKAKIRAGITYDAQTNSLYTVSNDGILYRITVSNKKISQVTSTVLVENTDNINCTSTPTVYNGRIYIGCIANRLGMVAVIDAKKMKTIYNVQGFANAEIKSSPLLSTRGESSGTVYVYVSANAFPGGIYYFTDSPTTTSGTLQTLFSPTTAQQFCLSSITAGSDGTLYYSNDSGTFFAIGKTSANTNTGNNSIAQPSPSSTPLETVKSSAQSVVSVKKPKKPTKVRSKKGRKKIQISWKKGSKKSQTILYWKYGSGKWSKKLIKKRCSITLVRKKKKLRIRLRSREKRKGTWYYSNYTKTFLLK